VAGYEVADSSGDTNGTQFGWTIGVLIQHEEVGVCEVSLNLGRDEGFCRGP